MAAIRAATVALELRHRLARLSYTWCTDAKAAPAVVMGAVAEKRVKRISWYDFLSHAPFVHELFLSIHDRAVADDATDDTERALSEGSGDSDRASSTGAAGASGS